MTIFSPSFKHMNFISKYDDSETRFLQIKTVLFASNWKIAKRLCYGY